MALVKEVISGAFILLALVAAVPLSSAEEDEHSEGPADRLDSHVSRQGHAHSYHHFSGPVAGHHEEISWKGKHGQSSNDYRAHPKYKYSYGVEDRHTRDYHGQKEHRDGNELEGEYHLHEPGGNLRTVKYYADPHAGFFAEVHNYGGNDHSSGQ